MSSLDMYHRNFSVSTEDKYQYQLIQSMLKNRSSINNILIKLRPQIKILQSNCLSISWLLKKWKTYNKKKILKGQFIQSIDDQNYSLVCQRNYYGWLNRKMCAWHYINGWMELDTKRLKEHRKKLPRSKFVGP